MWALTVSSVTQSTRPSARITIIGGLDCEQVGIDRGVLREGPLHACNATDQSIHFITHVKCGDARFDCRDDTGKIHSENSRHEIPRMWSRAGAIFVNRAD